MDKKIWPHPFASFLIKCKLQKEYRNLRLASNETGKLAAMGQDGTAEGESKTNPWMGVFSDPALHKALDRIMASNKID